MMIYCCSIYILMNAIICIYECYHYIYMAYGRQSMYMTFMMPASYLPADAMVYFLLQVVLVFYLLYIYIYASSVVVTCLMLLVVARCL